MQRLTIPDKILFGSAGIAPKNWANQILISNNSKILSFKFFGQKLCHNQNKKTSGLLIMNNAMDLRSTFFIILK